VATGPHHRVALAFRAKRVITCGAFQELPVTQLLQKSPHDYVIGNWYAVGSEGRVINDFSDRKYDL